ncbi:winged helix-turn-helix domain-containing protein [Streptomyces sp. NPDC127072]|uniref:winged helix-turn-helix domain-containing protein n=1 Tax=Streptomyces sp. NPDC127072 TaxID=3347129 RepID=UPI003664482C
MEIDGQDWYVLADALVSAGMEGADRNPMFVARIPGEHRQQFKLDGRWTWLVTEFGADFAAGQTWREHGDPKVIGHDRAATRAYAEHLGELYDGPKKTGGVKAKEPGRPKGKPDHERISDEIRRRILSGELRHGDLLPNSRNLAESCSVPRATALRAFKTLREEGLISTTRGPRAQPRVRKVVPDA